MRSSLPWLARLCATIVLVVCTDALAQTRPSDAPPPSADELHRMFDARQYHDVVRHAVKILSLKGEPAAQYDRQEVLRLKAEAHLRLGDAEPAAKAFDDAAQAAKDESAAAVDRATAVLARRARNNTYKPKTTSTAVDAGEGLSLLDPVGRKLALRALYEDERAAAQRRLDVPARASLAELIAALEAAVPLRTLELGATGATARTDDVIKPVCDRARELTFDQIKSMASRVDKLDKAANKKRKMGSAYRKRGLSSEEQGELRDIAGVCEQFAQAARRFEAAAATDAPTFAAIRAQAQALRDHATRLLSADYTIIYDRD